MTIWEDKIKDNMVDFKAGCYEKGLGPDMEGSRGARYYQYTGISRFRSPEIRIEICF